jgi:hypothetical protein
MKLFLKELIIVLTISSGISLSQALVDNNGFAYWLVLGTTVALLAEVTRTAVRNDNQTTL